MDPDLVFIVDYTCPRCHASLEVRSSASPSWHRCPACGRASLPPDPDRRPSSTFFGDDEALILGDHQAAGMTLPLPIQPRAMAPLPTVPSPRMPTNRLLLGTGFFLMTILFLFSLLESRGGRAGVFALFALICLILLSRSKNRTSED